MQEKMRTGWLAALMAVLAIQGCAVDEYAHDTADVDERAQLEESADIATVQQAVIAGTDLGMTHPEIGKWVRGTSSTFVCSAVLIGPREFLTAAHCINYQKEYVSDLDAVQFGTASVKVARVRSLGDNTSGKYDLAIGQLVAPVPATVAVPATLSTRMPNVGETVTIMGWGCVSSGGSSGQAKRYRTGTWGPQSNGVNAIPPWGCSGDSGGGLILGSVSGGGALAGINSAVDANATYFAEVPFFKERVEHAVRNMEVVEDGWNRPGSDLYSVSVQGTGACLTTCNRDARCRSFTYVPSSNTCWIKGAVPNPVPNSNVVSGLPKHFMLQTGLTGTVIQTTTQTSREACDRACAVWPSCSGWTYTGTTCSLFGYATTPAGVANANAVSGLRRSVDTGVDRFGNDLTSLSSPSALSCASACAGFMACKAWSYVPSATTCYLKGNVGSPSANSSVYSGVRGDYYHDANMLGADISSSTLGAPDPQACDVLCRNTSGCWSWTLAFNNAGAPVCWVKNAFPTPTSVIGLTSGFPGVNLM